MRYHQVKVAMTACAAVALGAAALPASASTVASASASADSPVRSPTVIVDCFSHPHVRPGRFLLACGDGNNSLTLLRWSRWGPDSAVATGRDVANDCVPYCAAGTFHSYRVTVRLDRAAPWMKHPHQRHYTRLHMVYTDVTPPQAPRDVTYKLWD